MKILIIGGSRFLGPIIIRKLLENGHNITVFNRGHIQNKYENVNFIKGDRDNGFPISEKFDVVIDMCAYLGEQTRRAINDLSFDFFIHMSSAASYKKSQSFPLTEESPLGDWPLWGEYNEGKVQCEDALERSGINYASIRPVYILGPNNPADREHFIYSKIKQNIPLILPGNGQASIQFVFAEDVANCIVLLAEKKLSGLYNCAGDDTITLQNLVLEIGKIVGTEPIIDYNPDADGENFDISQFPFANETFVCSNEKFRKLGIKFTPLIAGLKEDYKNYYSKFNRF
ncbi:NAD-dependent epimerase/dehydratase family protein [Candidatus Micrarchaeota archaeon]|nr:NAD-dependent epimerase/dehydratase family protein [Candidatus Micrarchaeota archaeon]